MPMARCVHFRAVYDDVDPLKGRLVPVTDASERMSGMGESGMRDGHGAARGCRAIVRGCGVSDGHRVEARHSGVYFLPPQRGLQTRVAIRRAWINPSHHLQMVIFI